MAPLVLAIEPDSRQAAIVKRIVREKVQADVTVVDSRDAALEAIRKRIPDVLLLSALLSPRDEDELIAHLRTLDSAEHLQTHTIPQLASTIDQDDDRPSRGLLSAFRRRKGSGSAPAGCDPDLFADEIRTYLKHAEDRKRELSEAAALAPGEPASRPMSAAHVSSSPRTQPIEESTPPPESSWASPFEWRPSRSAAGSSPRAEEPPARPAAEPAAPPVFETTAATAPAAFSTPASAPIITPPPEPISPVPESPAVAADPTAIEPDSTPTAAASMLVAAVPTAVAPDPAAAAAMPTPVPAPPALVAPPVVQMPKAARGRLPLVKRYAREWWFEDQEPRTEPSDTDSEVREVLASLSIPLHVAAMGYAEGCRIRRVRLIGE